VSLIAIDGVVGVLHPLGETEQVHDLVLEALPGWRPRSLFSYSGASAEAPTFSLFAHPEASAEVVGFSGVEEGGPAASEILAHLDAHLEGDLFSTPLLVPSFSPTCAWLIPDRLLLVFEVDVAEDDRLELIDSIGGVVIWASSDSSAHVYMVRVEEARSGLEILALANSLAGSSLLRYVHPDLERHTMIDGGCGGPLLPGGGSGGSGGSGAQPLAVPTLGATAKILLVAWIAAAGALLLGRRRP
jgi:hypothetical protein